MTNIIQHTSTTAPKRFQCRHIHTEGRRCGSASLRGEEFCYFHHNSRKPVSNPRTRRSRQATFDLPLPEDRGAIQISIGEVLRRIASNAIDPRRAGLLLYGLQIASLNLPKPTPVPAEQGSLVEETVTDPTHGPIAPTTELPDPDAPRPNSLIGRLLDQLRRGRELDAQTPTAESVTPSEVEEPPIRATEPVIPSEVEEPAFAPAQPVTLPNLSASSEASVSRCHPERSRGTCCWGAHAYRKSWRQEPPSSITETKTERATASAVTLLKQKREIYEARSTSRKRAALPRRPRR
jgi:hypothetical protein